MADKKIYGQDHLLKELDLIFKGFKASDGKIKPHFILTGPSGNGKTETIDYFAEKYKLNVIEINAAGLTKEGLSGNSFSKTMSHLGACQNSPTVAFVDEFDKMFISSDGTCDAVHEATRGVQNEFLKALEGKTMQVFGDYGKFNSVSTSKVLFIFAGAFNNETNININRLSQLGVKREFLGRVPLIYEVKRLTLDNLLCIAENHQFLTDWMDSTIPKKEQDEVKSNCINALREYIAHNYDSNVIGARWIGGLIHKYFVNGMELPVEDLSGTMPNPPMLDPNQNFFSSDEARNAELAERN